MLGLATFGYGYSSYFRLNRLTAGRIKALILFIILLLTIGAAAFHFKWLNPDAANTLIKGLYITAGCFFLGNAVKIETFVFSSGRLEYKNPTLPSLIIPYFIAATIILYGFYRADFFSDAPILSVGNVSGLSLVTFGTYAWTLNLTPEFRTGGMLILDQLIPWPSFISFNLENEEIICLEYYDDQENIRIIKTHVPKSDQKKLCRLLERHIIDTFNDNDDMQAPNS